MSYPYYYACVFSVTTMKITQQPQEPRRTEEIVTVNNLQPSEYNNIRCQTHNKIHNPMSNAYLTCGPGWNWPCRPCSAQHPCCSASSVRIVAPWRPARRLHLTCAKEVGRWRQHTDRRLPVSVCTHWSPPQSETVEYEKIVYEKIRCHTIQLLWKCNV